MRMNFRRHMDFAQINIGLTTAGLCVAQ